MNLEPEQPTPEPFPLAVASSVRWKAGEEGRTGIVRDLRGAEVGRLERLSPPGSIFASPLSPGWLGKVSRHRYRVRSTHRRVSWVLIGPADREHPHAIVTDEVTGREVVTVHSQGDHGDFRFTVRRHLVGRLDEDMTCFTRHDGLEIVRIGLPRVWLTHRTLDFELLWQLDEVAFMAAALAAICRRSQSRSTPAV